MGNMAEATFLPASLDNKKKRFSESTMKRVGRVARVLLKVERWLNRCVIHPNSSFKTLWDLMVLVFVLYTAITAPLKVAYQVDFLTVLEAALDGLFCLDLVVQAFSGYFNLGGSRFPVLEFRLVIRHYARTWLLLDLMAAIPFDVMVPELRALSLVKTVRLVKVRRILRKFNQMSIAPLLRVFTILTLWVLCMHWLACGFFIMGWATCSSYAESDGAANETYSSLGDWFDNEQAEARCASQGSRCNGNWITEYWPLMREQCIAGVDPEVAARQAFLTIGSVHVRALSWALATMSSLGYGRAPVAVSDADHIYSIVTQV